MLKRGKFRSIIAILIMAILPIGMFFWMTYERELLSKPILLAKEDLKLGTIIDDPYKYFDIVKVDNDLLINNSLTPDLASSIVGKGLTQFVPAKGQVSINFFDNPGIIVTDDKQVFKIPSNWVYAVPSSIRRGDIVKFYEVDANIEESFDSASINLQEFDPENEVLFTYEGKIKVGSKDPVLTSTVIYVKDGSNREVVDATGTPLRYDGTSQISSVEIVCSRDDIQNLIDRVQAGFKFILVY